MNSRFTLAVHLTGMIAWIDREQSRSATSAELAASAGAHDVFVRGILGDLSRANIVRSQRGRNGGTTLARPAVDITLADVYRAVGEHEKSLLGDYPGGGEKSCIAGRVIETYLSSVYRSAEAVLMEDLTNRTIDEMSRHVAGELQKRTVQSQTHSTQ
ncbi:MAG: Rrf2 family transcriptional regulator [Pseudomonadota bacterium]